PRPRAAHARFRSGVDLRSRMTGAPAVLVTADRAIVAPSPGDPCGSVRGPTAVLAIDGAIAAVGDPDDVAADPRAIGAHRIAWPHRAMVPGTVNTHNHSFQSLLRGIGDDLP